MLHYLLALHFREEIVPGISTEEYLSPAVPHPTILSTLCKHCIISNSLEITFTYAKMEKPNSDLK